MSDTPAETSAASARVANPVKPLDPIMGKFFETIEGSGNWNARLGGKPKSDWSGIDDTDISAGTVGSSLRYRPLNPARDQTGQKDRCKGLSTPFKEGDSLQDFQDDVWKHLQVNGLDTIAYVKDPQDQSKVLAVVHDHPKFRADESRFQSLANEFRDKFDSFDSANDEAAREFLTNSISGELKKTMRFKLSVADSFASVWLKLMKQIISSSTDRFEAIRARIKARTPMSYSGQDIEKMSEDNQTDANMLISAGCYEHNLTKSMIQCSLKSTVKGKFSHDLFDLENKVEAALQYTTFMSTHEIDRYFAQQGLTMQDVNIKVTALYRVLKDTDGGRGWPPSKISSDSKVVPRAFAAITDEVNDVESLKKEYAKQLLVLLQTGALNKGGTPVKDISCFGCGAKGFTKRTCPKCKTSYEAGKGGRGPKSHGNDKGGGGWKTKAPASGESQTKDSNGRTFHWCAKCKRWSTTHSTDTHVSKTPGSSRGGGGGRAAANALTFDTSAWMAMASPTPSHQPSTLKPAFLTIMKFVLLAYATGAAAVFMSHFLASINVVPVLLSMWSSLNAHVWSQWYTFYAPMLAPVTWFLAGYFACHIQHATFCSVTTDDLIKSKTTKDFRRQWKKPVKPRVKLRSAFDHGLHRSYPHRLRRDNVFHTRNNAPSVTQRCANSRVDNWCNQADRRSRAKQLRRDLLPVRPVTIWRSTSAPPITPERTKFLRKRIYGNHVPANCPPFQRIAVFDDNFMGPAYCKPRPKYSNADAATLLKEMFGDAGTCHPRRHEWKPRHRHRRSYHVHPSRSVKGTFGNKPPAKHMDKVKVAAEQVYMASVTVSKALQIALHSPSAFRTAQGPQASYPIIWDSGASVSITNSKSDFVSFNPDPSLPTLKSLGGTHQVKGEGIVNWKFQDGNGMLRSVKMKAFYIPECSMRLLSTSSLLQEYSDETIHLDGSSLHLSGIPGDPERASVTVALDRRSNLPTSFAYSHDPEETVAQVNNLIAVTSDENINLSEPEKELMRWHCRLGHLAFSKVQHLLRSGVLSHSETTRRLHASASKIQRPPRCAACQFGKQKALRSPGKATAVVKDKAGVISQGHLLPGAETSVDHFVCSTKGRLSSSFGRSRDEDMYCGGCIFVDHASGYIHVVNQTSLSSHQTLRAKEEFELMCRDHGVVPQRYLSDNGKAFTSKEFHAGLQIFSQSIRYAGVGAHHHNGVAERSIGTVMSIARTMMLHSAVHWPDVADASLWPFAVLHAVYIWNHCPNPHTGISPSDLFTKSRWPHSRFHDLHVWGCPVYVLDKTIADGKKIPKWKPRSSRSMYLGRSLKHASTVPLVLNLETGAITPQFHVVFDDWFATVSSTIGSLPDFSSDAWMKLFGDSAYQYVPHESIEDAVLDPSDATNSARHSIRQDHVAASFENSVTTQVRPLPVLPPVPLSNVESGVESRRDPSPTPVLRRDEPSAQPSPVPVDVPAPAPGLLPRRESVHVQPKPSPVLRASQPAPVTTRSTTTRPRRNRSRPQVLTFNELGTSTSKSVNTLAYASSHMLYHLGMDAEPFISSFDASTAYKAKVNTDPDILTFDQAMQDPQHRDAWRESALAEIRQLESKGTWKEVPLSDATSRVLPGTWVFRQKRRPDGEIKKFKSRYCCRGDLEEGKFDTYAPVVAFPTVRLFLISALKMGWKTQSIDFSNAFVQSDLDHPVWIHLPRGFHSTIPGKSCLKLVKSLYGLSVAPKLWYQLVLKALKAMGFKQSSIDACLFFKVNIFLIVYVDDVGIAYSDSSYLEELIEGFQSRGFELTREGSFAEFLGIQYEHQKDGTVTLSQQGLIKKILKAADMVLCNPQWTPAAKDTLGIDPDGELMSETWNYRSIVGMLLYLSTNTRPDISFSVSQVARFSHSPKQSHAIAVKRILRYLKRTETQGTNVNFKNEEFKLDCFVDADFAGLFGSDPHNEPSSVKSRTGYIVKLAGCPLIWKSQLQSSIALSTGESEYSALSQSMRVLLPLRSQLIELLTEIGMSATMLGSSTIRSIAHEDNSSALSLATDQRITSRTRHYAVKWHFFWEHVRNGTIEVVKVPTADQCADYLTKGLVREVFERCRRLSQGW